MIKLKELRRLGIDPYPARVARTLSISDFLDDFLSLEKKEKKESLVGRIMSIRQHGGIIFGDLFDGTGRVQFVLKEEDLEKECFERFLQVVDTSDFISISGIAFTTKRGEKSLKVESWRMASKSLMPIPSEWYGVKDEELRFRQRYLEILLNPETRKMLERRSNFWQTIRSFLIEKGFLEVETPVLETEPGGADARPFITHHNALDMDVFLRISAGELWQKRLLIAGFPKIFEIGRIFRNEGISNEHLQDYTQLEFYQAFSDFEEGMLLIQELYKTIVKNVYGTTKFTIRENAIDFDSEWERIDYCKLLKKNFDIDPLTCTDVEAVEAVKKAGIFSEEVLNKSRAIDLLWKSIRRDIAGPAFLTGVPVFLEPLAKRASQNLNIVERFQIILAGSEMGKGFSELNDPLDQRLRFEQQQQLRDEGDEEAQRMDKEYLEALEYGMPPAFGFGVSERLFSFLENKNVREAQFFPLLKPRND